jgi:prepilin-type N-terminal cleavage/methylation domain-containing protein
MNKKGFTLIEMLTTTAIMVIVFGLLALIFGRATTIHKVVRSGGDAENFGIYLINTISYGPGTSREEGLIGAQTGSFASSTNNNLQFYDTNGNVVTYTLGDVTGDLNTLTYGSVPVDLKPTWAKDKGLGVSRELDVSGNPLSEFLYYDTSLTQIPTPSTNINVGYVGIKLTLKSILQNAQEAVTLYRCVRIRNQIDF